MVNIIGKLEQKLYADGYTTEVLQLAESLSELGFRTEVECVLCMYDEAMYYEQECEFG